MTVVDQLMSSLRDLIESDMPNTQMDIFYADQVIMQIYDQSDVKGWNLPVEIPFGKKGGIVIDLTFNKAKRRNKENLQRFMSSSFFSNFIMLDEGYAKTFLFPIDSQISIKEITQILSKLILEVYDFKENDIFEVRVRAF